MENTQAITNVNTNIGVTAQLVQNVDVAISYANKAETYYRNCVSAENAVNEINAITGEYEYAVKKAKEFFPFWVEMGRRHKAFDNMLKLDFRITDNRHIFRLKGLTVLYLKRWTVCSFYCRLCFIYTNS